VTEVLLFQDDELMVRARPGEVGRPVLVAFGHLESRPEEAFWGGELATAIGWPSIGLTARRANWFPADSVRAAAGAVRARLAALGPGPAIGYGYSMGGHAALRHGRLLGIGHALAVSPQFSIDPGEAAWDRRFRPFHLPTLNPGMAVRPDDLPPVSWMLADRHHPEDGAHARALQRIGVRSFHTPWMNHGPIDLLAGRAVAEAALRAVLAEDATALRSLLRARRHRSPVWQAGLGAALLVRGREPAGEALLGQAAASGLDAEALATALAEALRHRPGRSDAVAPCVAGLGVLASPGWLSWSNQMAALDQPAAALAIVEAGLTASGPQDSPRVRAALLTQAGHLRLRFQRPGARAALEEAVALDPADGWALVGLCRAYRLEGKLEAAAAAGRAAMRQRPDDPRALLQHAAVLMDLRRFREAEPLLLAALPVGGTRTRARLFHARLRSGKLIAAWTALLGGLVAHPVYPALRRGTWFLAASRRLRRWLREWRGKG